MKDKWYKGKVIEGDKLGRELGFPTLNIDKPSIFRANKKGVYLVQLKIKSKRYSGLLFFGPRLILKQNNPVLEIFVLDFDQNIYGETVTFQPIKYLREVMDFPDEKLFRNQLSKDVRKAKEIILLTSK